MSVRVDLPPAPRLGTRKRKRAQVAEDDSDDDDEVAVKSGTSRGKRRTIVEDSDDDEDNDNADANTNDKGENNNDNADSDEEMADPDNDPEPTLRRSTRQSARTSPPTAAISAADVPHEGPSPRAIVNAKNPVTAAAPFKPVRTAGELRDQNIELAAANQDFARINQSLREQVQSFTRAITNIIEDGLAGNAPTAPIVHGALMLYSRGDGRMAEQQIGKITAELQRRYEQNNAPVAPAPQPQPQPPRRRLTDAELMPPPPRPQPRTSRHVTPRSIYDSPDNSPLSDPPSDLND